jgi:hypothetical protein
MPTKPRKLKTLAKESCEIHSHSMSKFIRLKIMNVVRPQFRSKCINCGMTVDVKLLPYPNEAHISGNAVALNCCSDNNNG